MKVTVTVDESALEITGPNDFRLLLGKGTTLNLELKGDYSYNLREHVEEAPRPPKRKPKLTVVKGARHVKGS